jgi:predicted Rossmann-fold nucleotide-binding protein
LFEREHWTGLVDWLRQAVKADGMISQADLRLLQFADTPEQVRDVVLRAAEAPPSYVATEEAARSQTRSVMGRRDP